MPSRSEPGIFKVAGQTPNGNQYRLMFLQRGCQGRECPADGRIGFDFHAKAFDIRYPLGRWRGKLEFGNHPGQHPAGFRSRLIDGHPESRLHQVMGRRETRRPGTDNAYGLLLRALRGGRFFARFQGLIGYQTLDPLDRDRFIHNPSNAFLLAGMVTDPATDHGEGIRVPDDLHGFVELALGGRDDITRDIHSDRTNLTTGGSPVDR